MKRFFVNVYAITLALLCAAAKENGVECIIIKRPTDESGMTVSEVEKMILEWL